MSALEAIRARAEAATPGPWSGIGAANIIPESGPPIGRITRAANQSFVAHSRTDVPKLIAALDAAQDVLTEAQESWKGMGLTHDQECHKHHASCLAMMMQDLITEALA